MLFEQYLSYLGEICMICTCGGTLHDDILNCRSAVFLPSNSPLGFFHASFPDVKCVVHGEISVDSCELDLVTVCDFI